MKMQYLMHHLLQDSAASYPDKIFVIQEDRQFSFREVDRITDGIAHAILASGAGRYDRVGVFFDHRLEQIFSFFGILKAGSVYVPMNSQLLGEQVEHIARDCQMTGLIVDADRLDLLRDVLPKWNFLKFVMVLGDIPKWVSACNLQIIQFDKFFSDTVPMHPISGPGIGSDLAALLYTSGSTGRPKGVMISHGNLIAGAQTVASYLCNQHADRLLGVLPLSFDAGLNQLTCCTLLGMTYVMKAFRFPGELVDVMLKEKISGFAGIPTVWLLLLQAGSPVYKNTFSHLRYVTNTGGVLPVHAIEKLKKVFPGTKIFLMYGLTEAFRSTFLPPDQLEKRPTSMGRAIPGAEILVVNKEGKLCGPNEPGELVHRGPTVALGYWGNEEKTKEVYRPNIFLPSGLEHTERLVYSGDLVKKDEDGYLYFIGRQDGMIKCYGHRISPSEIEEVFYATGKVKLAAAIGVEDHVRGQSIKVFAVLNDNAASSEEELLDYCAQKLPQFMMPRWIDIVDDLPRTGSGKVDMALLKRRPRKDIIGQTK
jgi:acyl-CoA ligase (AMP-forming) (exosortase A-associated)